MCSTLGARRRAVFGTRLRILALVGGMVTFGGCATAGGLAERAAPNLQPAGLIIRNNNWNAMTVYVVQGGERRRVGDVSGFSVAVFSEQRLGLVGSPGNTFLLARPLGGRAFRSDPLMFSPGRTLIWTIENQPALSYLSAR